MFTHCLRNFRPFKNFFGSGSIFRVFAYVACILIGKDEEYEKKTKWKNAHENFGLGVQWP